MPKNKISDYSTTAASNTDIGGIAITGNSLPSNFDDALRTLMAHLAASNIVRNCAPLETEYTSSGTHTFQPATQYFQILGCGGGAAGQSVQNGGATASASGCGGSSGFFGESIIFPKTAATAAVTIGVGGIDEFNSGGITQFNDGTNFEIFVGGMSNGDLSVSTSTFPSLIRSFVTNGFAPRLSINPGGPGISGNSTTTNSGEGGCSPWGIGGHSVMAPSGSSSAGLNAQGYGAGGGGASRNHVASPLSDTPGGAGSPGKLIVREW